MQMREKGSGTCNGEPSAHRHKKQPCMDHFLFDESHMKLDEEVICNGYARPAIGKTVK